MLKAILLTLFVLSCLYSNDDIYQLLSNTIKRDLNDQQKLVEVKESTTIECIKPNNISASTKVLSVDKQRDVLFTYTNKWKEYEACINKSIKTSNNINLMFEKVKKGTECNPAFHTFFDTWFSPAVSEYTYYIMLADCGLTKLKRQQHLLKVLLKLIEKNEAQTKWEEYVSLECSVKNIYNFEDEFNINETHPLEVMNNLHCVNELFSYRINVVYNDFLSNQPMVSDVEEEIYKKD